MVRLSQSQERARRRIMELGRRSLLPTALGAELLTAIASVVPADRLSLFGVDPHSLLINRVFASQSRVGHDAGGWFRTTYFVSEPWPELSCFGLIRAAVPAYVLRESIETSWYVPPRLSGLLAPDHYRREYAEVNAPAGGILRASFKANGMWVAFFDCVRFEATQPFAPSDVVFLRTVGPLIGAAIAGALVREEARAATDASSPHAAGVLLLAPDGRMRFQTPMGEAWLRLLNACWWEPGSGVNGLPAGVWAASAPLRVRHHPGAIGVVRTWTPAGAVRIEATVGDAADGTIAVVINDDQPTSAPPIPLDWPLTEAERRTVALLVEGQSNAEIARQLAVSEKTIETHLGHVYEKLGVGSRLEVVASYFRQTHLPTLGQQNGASHGT